MVGFVKPAAQAQEQVALTPADWDLRCDETLAAGERLWVRGRLVRKVAPDSQAASARTGWLPWRRRVEPFTAPRVGRLEIELGPHKLSTPISLDPDGEFEAVLMGQRPPARRGWSVARQRLLLGNLTLEKCAVVLSPPPEATEAVVVLLPVGIGPSQRGLQQFMEGDRARTMTGVLRGLREAGGPTRVFYYVACAPCHRLDLASQLALGSTTLGWPAGTVIALPQGVNDTLPTLTTGLDRLRWLLAGRLEIRLFNLEPSMVAGLSRTSHEQTDRARILESVGPADPIASAAVTTRNTFTDGGTRRWKRASLVPRYPVVFCHGMLALTTLRMQLPEDWNCFRPLGEFLQERGLRALYPKVWPTGGVAARAEQLRDEIKRWTDEPVNVIAHSMGGLDARYMITHLGMADYVRSLTTIATPHRGSYLVDWFIQNFRRRIPLLVAFEAAGFNVDGFRDCQRAVCAEMNARTPDMPSLRYFSFGASVSGDQVTPVLRRAWNLLAAAEGPNDGMVSLTSARWGEYLGTLHADHFAQTPDMTFVRPGEDFDCLGFYSRLLEDLARRGF